VNLVPKPTEARCPRCQTLTSRLDLLSRRSVRENCFRCLSCHHVWKAEKPLVERRSDERVAAWHS
jgi:hypothetical protein